MSDPDERRRERRVLDRVGSLTERQIAWTRELVAIPTVNPYSGDDSAAVETPGQDWIADRLRALGAQVRRVPVPPDVYERGGLIGPRGRSWENRDNVVAQWVLGSDQGPAVLVNGHMDTVGTAGMTIRPFDPVIRDGRIYGRGTSDSKGNLAMALVALEALLEDASGLNGRLVFESVVDEECDGAGAGTLACCLAGVTGDLALCLDGSWGSIDNGCNGIATARVLVRGQAGHSSRTGSVSAIDKAIVVKQAIDTFGAEYQQVHPGCLCNVGVLRAGTRAAIVPGEAVIEANLNYHHDDAARAEAETGRWGGALFRARFETAMRELSRQDAWLADNPARIEWIKDMHPFLCEPADPYLQLIAEAFREVSGEDVPVKPLNAWFDASHLARQLKIPVAGAGCGTMGAAHSADEFAVLDHLLRGAKALALALRRLLRDHRPGRGQ